MIDKNLVLEAISEWNNWDSVRNTGIERIDYLEKLNRLTMSGQVVMVSGVRRSGKSYILRQFANKLDFQANEKEKKQMGRVMRETFPEFMRRNPHFFSVQEDRPNEPYPVDQDTGG